MRGNGQVPGVIMHTDTEYEKAGVPARYDTKLWMPVPRLQAASCSTGWFRQLASSTSMDVAQISPSTVNGSSRAVMPDSPCERTSSYAC